MVYGKVYAIEKIKRTETRFGQRILVITEDHLIYLPQRYTNLSDEDLESIASSPHGIEKKGEYNICMTKM